MLPGGSTQEITLRFSPKEVEDVGRVLVCHLPALEQVAQGGNAAYALKAITREVMGKVRRASSGCQALQ